MKRKPLELETMLQEGYTRRFAKRYLTQLGKENEMSCFDTEYRRWAHEYGFYVENASSYPLSPENIDYYLSDYDYYKVWPLNNWTRIWINDKLTIKYLLADSPYGDIMPKYYFYTTKDSLVSLIDTGSKEGSIDNFVNVLKEVGEFACKPCNGTTAIGFFKLSYSEGCYFFNDNIITIDEIKDIISKHPNYIFTEYLRPDPYFKKISDQIHTLRIVTLNERGNTPIIVGGYLRFPTRYNGKANYTVLDGDDVTRYNLFIDLDINNGHFYNAKRTFINRTEPTLRHPDSNELLDGYIPNWQDVKEQILGIAQRFNTLEWLGFDIGITENGIKCMEVNSHPGIKYMQIFKPLYDNEILAEYFERKLCEIDNMTENEKAKRNETLR